VGPYLSDELDGELHVLHAAVPVHILALPAAAVPILVAALHPVSAQWHAAGQGLTLVHFSAQRKRFLWDRGCI